MARPAGDRRVTPLADGCDQPLVQRHDTVLLDLDGVLYVGPNAVPGAPDAVAAVRAAGVGAAFVTNNAARTPQTVAAHLTDLGILARPEDVVTSAQAVAALVAAAVPAGSPVLVVGGEGLAVALSEEGLRAVSSAADRPRAVVQGFSPDVGWRQLAEATYAVRAGVPWYASNLDSTLPTAAGVAPGNGALVGVVAAATGRMPVVAGKPATPLHDEAVRRTHSLAPLVVGDRLDTDIQGAFNAGVPSLLVLTGLAGPVDVVLAGPQQRPTYVAKDLPAGLLEPHPPVRRVEGGGRRCGGWVVRARQDGIDVRGEGDPVDGLRALAVASWEAGGPAEDDVRAALAHLFG
ncbi:MAG: HAD-IIA family hydrolase [Actinomycetes bacterium]